MSHQSCPARQARDQAAVGFPFFYMCNFRSAAPFSLEKRCEKLRSIDSITSVRFFARLPIDAATVDLIVWLIAGSTVHH